jgi:hypothetical protein
MKNLVPITLTLLSFAALANVTILKKDMNLKVATIEAEINCIETNYYFDETSYKCSAQEAVNKATRLLRGKILDTKATDSLSSSVLYNQVDEAGTYKVKLNLIYVEL